MSFQVIMPQLGESVVEGTISKWLKSKGEHVEEFEPLLEINTDKVDSEIPSPASGILLDILVLEGTTVTAGTLLAWIGEANETPEEIEARSPQAVIRESDPPAATIEHPQFALPMPTSGRNQNLGFISPVVAKIAAEQGIDLSQVRGTGQAGRITKKDVLTFIEARQDVTTPPGLTPSHITTLRVEPAQPADRTAESKEILPGEILPLNPVRRAIADHMVMSKRTSPHVTTVMEADLNRIVAHRQANKDTFARDGINLTFTAYFVAATVSALKTFPIVNSTWRDEGILIQREINIGMATSLGESGLIVPVIKNADGFSLLGLARVVNDLAHRARARQLKPEEVKGGTFTITNHGISGSLFATPIIYQPQCGILGIGAIQKRVTVIEDAIAIRPMVFLSLTFDHRILDGATADYFLARVVESLEKWN
jgi:pyruvate/2-oxoglutarate dehydrogenase complex dihydrolipoamide acyltransferase (E2) component